MLQLALIGLTMQALLFSLTAEANVLETFKCQAGLFYSEGGEIVLIARITGDDTGSVEVSGVTQTAYYTVQGFNRRWDFGPLKENGFFPYSFVIQPDSTGLYYDFSRASSEVTASQVYSCMKL